MDEFQRSAYDWGPLVRSSRGRSTFSVAGPDDGGEDLFCHTSSLKGCKGLGKGDKVRYEPEYDDRKGKMRAVNVSIEGGGGGGGGGDRRDDRRDDRRRDYDRRDDRRDDRSWACSWHCLFLSFYFLCSKTYCIHIPLKDHKRI